ncbi:MAG: DNA mismatch repair endonuclease MutL [Pirellulaceae bacterium]
MPTIRQLPPSVVNKIAAGEVIERPASVVKELLENAVDAGASRIDVSLAAGGMDLIRVSDDGCGIAPEQLVLAISSHATSKIADADDLFRVGTFGFRGEALASIAEVSQLCLRSKTREATSGAELEVDGGKRTEVMPCGAPVGTTMEVRNLFFNTPVRRKFMRAVQTEIGHASEAFTRIALAHPQVHFTLRHNDRQLFDLPPVATWRERIAAFFGREIEAALIPLDSTDGGVRLTGFAVDPQYSRGNNRMQYLFLNGRHIRDRALQHALGEAYRGLLLHGRFPMAFLLLEMPPDLVDVNVHPTKLEVRFQDSGRVYSLLLGSLRKRFLATDLTAKVRAPSSEEGDPAGAHDGTATVKQRQELVQWAKGQLAGSGTAANSAVALAEDDEQAALELRFDKPPDQMLHLNRIDRSWSAVGGPQAYNGAVEVEPVVSEQGKGASGGKGVPATILGFPNRSHLGFQIHNRYLVTENEAGMVVIDQHALHERVLYEQIRAKVLSGRLESQRLLVPEPVALAPAEAAAALEAKETLAKLGIDIEPFGGDTILVSSYPAMLANIDPAELLRQVVDGLLAGGKMPEQRDLLNDLLNMVACKAAVKAGDYLAPEEITALLEQRHHYQDTHHCPHGRPTALVFTREELDKRFKRT